MNKQAAREQQADLVPNGGLQDLIVDLLNSLSALKALSEINCEIADEKNLIKQALAGLIRNQDMEKCSFFIVDSDGLLSNVTGISVRDLTEETVWTGKALSFRVGEGVIGAAAASGKIQHCRNCAEDPRFAVVGDHGSMPGSIICAPVFTLHDVLIGVLNISHPEPNYFTDWHLRLLDLYTTILGQLITNRRLFQQMEAQITMRTAELQRLVTETSALKDYYASMSMHDQLTGLHNRRYFYDQVELALAQHHRYKNPFCLIVMDIDHFKAINDRYGHIFGDQVLVRVAESLKRQVRSSDILVRFGGEEFVVIFSNTSCESGFVMAERIRNEIKGLSWDFNGEAVTLTMSMGLYCSNMPAGNPEQSLDIDQIVHFADTACYAAKQGGRDRVAVFSENL